MRRVRRVRRMRCVTLLFASSLINYFQRAFKLQFVMRTLGCLSLALTLTLTLTLYLSLSRSL